MTTQAFYLQVRLSPCCPFSHLDIDASLYQYKNVKPDVSLFIYVKPVSDDRLAPQYLNAIWNVINFKEAEKRFVEAAK